MLSSIVCGLGGYTAPQETFSRTVGSCGPRRTMLWFLNSVGADPLERFRTDRLVVLESKDR